MSRISLTVHPSDNVSTLLDFKTEERTTQDGLLLRESIPFGHKVARQENTEGQAVIKYGVSNGKATKTIQAGEHVHVHNCC